MGKMNKSDGKPRVSIGMPVYNGGDLLKLAIESLLAQEYGDFEFVICDNASTDGTEELCRSYASNDPRIIYHRRDRNYGMSDNGRKAFSLATKGIYYLMASHDDQWHPSFLKRCVECLDANPSVVMAVPAVQFLSPKGVPCEFPYPPLHTVGMGLRSRVASIFNETNVGYNSYGLYRRDVLEKIRLDIKCYGNDVIYLLLISLIGEVQFISEKLFYYRLNGRTAQEQMDAISKGLGGAEKPYTTLTINLMRAIMGSSLSSTMKRVILSDIIQIIAVKNQAWRSMIIKENPSILPFIEPAMHGNCPSVESNLVAVFSSLLLPFCYQKTAFEGCIDFSETGSFDDIPDRDKIRPAPGHSEFVNTIVTLFEQKNYVKALCYYDEYRNTQPRTELVKKIEGAIESFRPVFKTGTVSSLNRKKLKILFQNRANSLNMPGGDSVVQKRLQEQLESRGHTVDLSTDADVNLSGYDIVHSFNMCLPQELEKFLNNAIKYRKPFVVTSLQEDMPLYLKKALITKEFFENYIRQGQDPGLFDGFKQMLSKAVPVSPQTSKITALYAHRLLACGNTEASYLQKLFQSAKISVIPFGSSIIDTEISGDLFKKTYGLENFVLCVGRLEIRKNQLMLLKALENDNIPVVFADAGFSYDPMYASFCKAFRRKGPTLFTGRLTDKMLVSAFRAARVHCLPSWYELPGLVTLEAARYGCATVASSWGAIRDYLGDLCEYCEPDSPESIRDAVLRAMDKGPTEELRELASKFTWEEAVKKVEDVYYEIV